MMDLALTRTDLFPSSEQEVGVRSDPILERYLFTGVTPSAGREKLHWDTLGLTSGSSIFHQSNEYFDLLKSSGFEIRNINGVKEFINDHPSLVPVLLAAKQNIIDYFPEGRLALDPVIEYGAEDKYLVLIIEVQSDDPDETSKTLDNFDQNWWLRAVAFSNGLLSLDLEFV